LESNLDDSLNTSSANLIPDISVRGHSKTISHMGKPQRGETKIPSIQQARRELNQESSILKITEENIEKKKVTRTRTQSQTRTQQELSQISIENSNLCTRQMRTQGYKEFLRQRMKTKFTGRYEPEKMGGGL